MKLKALSLIDIYKTGHVYMYPDGTTCVYSNFTARSGAHSNLRNKKFGKTVFVGLYGTIQLMHKIWDKSFFKKKKSKCVAAYKRRIEGILGPEQDVKHIEDLHDLGYLPIEIRALEEGTLVPYKVPYFTIHNTEPRFAWVTNFLEDFLSTSSWKAINNATLAYEMRSILTEFSTRQGIGTDFIPWQGHDFSFRGMSGVYDGAMTAWAHLTSFSGSDAVSGIDYVEKYYGADIKKQLVSGSVPATEHSVMCAGGEAGELQTFRDLFAKYPKGILSVVSDSWDFFRVITDYAEILKDEIMTRDGKLVYRPDSGDPVDILCGTAIAVKDTDIEMMKKYDGQVIKYIDHNGLVCYSRVVSTNDDYNGATYGLERLCDEEITKEMRGAVELLWSVFGGTSTNGFRTLDSHVGLIYGDSINADRMYRILERLENVNFAANNVVFGIGSYSYNMSSRDTHGMAMKATWVVVNGEQRNIQKDPKTGDGMKKSATGLLNVYRDEQGELYLIDKSHSLSDSSLLELVYRNGMIMKKTFLSGIRKRLWNWDDSL